MTQALFLNKMGIMMKTMKKLIALSLLLSISFLQANRQELIDAALQDDSDALEANLDYLNKQDKHGDTPLMTIIKIRTNEKYSDDQIINAVSMLLRNKANHELANNDGNNPLLKVVSSESYRNNEILERLLFSKWFGLFVTKKAINVEVKDKHGNTPLIRASGAGNNYAVKRLLKFGVDIQATNNQGYTALGRADKAKNKTAFVLLSAQGATVKKREANADEHPFIAAAYEGDIDAMHQLIEQDSSLINMQNKDGRTALFIVTDAGNIEAVRFLLEHGADVNIKNNDGNNPLLKAVNLPLEKNAIKIIALLLDNNADITVQDKYDRNPCERATDPKIVAAIKKQCRNNK
jgi:ankyrin repeat protein